MFVFTMYLMYGGTNVGTPLPVATTAPPATTAEPTKANPIQAIIEADKAIKGQIAGAILG